MKIAFERTSIKEAAMIQNIIIIHHVNSALRAHKIYTRDVSYIVKNRQVIIIDNLQDMMGWSSFSEDHQSIEAKKKFLLKWKTRREEL